LGHEKNMGWLLVLCIAAMTSFMTMVRLVALTLTMPTSPVPQTVSIAQIAKSVPAKSSTKKNVVRHRSAHHANRYHKTHMQHMKKGQQAGINQG